MATANEARAEWKSIMAKIDALPEQFKADIASHWIDARQGGPEDALTNSFLATWKTPRTLALTLLPNQ